jgi:hypothetical protein
MTTQSIVDLAGASVEAVVLLNWKCGGPVGESYLESVKKNAPGTLPTHPPGPQYSLNSHLALSGIANRVVSFQFPKNMFRVQHEIDHR